MSLAEDLHSLLENEDLLEPVERVARLLVNGDGFTLNLIPAAIVGFLTTLALGAIFSVPLTQFFSSMVSGVGGSSGYGYPGYQRSDQYYDQVVADLHSQVAQLKEQEETLRSQIYYSTYNSAPGET